MRGQKAETDDYRTAIFVRLCELQAEVLRALTDAQSRLHALAYCADKDALLSAMSRLEAAHGGFLQRLASLGNQGEDAAPVVPREARLIVPPRVPHSVAAAGVGARQRYIAFFTEEMRNPDTSRSYATIILKFFAWCEQQGVRSISEVEPETVGKWVRSQKRGLKPATAGQRISVVRRLMDWMAAGGFVSSACVEELSART